MDDSSRLKLIILGLVLAAIAGGYLFFSGRFASKTNNKIVQATPAPSMPPLVFTTPTPTPRALVQASTLPVSGVSGTNVNNLPKTGIPMDLLGSIGAAGIVIGYALKRFSK